MKTFYYVLMAACLAGGLASCSKDNPSDDPTPTLSVDNEEITLNATNASSVQLTVPAGVSWKAIHNSPWLNVTPAEGTGSGQLSFKFNDLGYRAVSSVINVTIMTNSGSATVKVTLPTPANQKPAATTAAVYPTNNATDVSTELRFVWKEAVDPDGDKLTYILEYSTDQETWTTVGASQGIKSTGYADGSKTLTPETKYYWRVTSWDMFGEKSDPSETFSFTTGSAAAGTWTDGEARLYQDNTNGSSDAFTIIVSGDGFTADDMKPGGHWDQVSVRAIESLFTNVEPYKTYRPYLRIWRVAAISNESGISDKSGGTETPCSTLKDTKFGTMYDNTSSSAWCGLYDDSYPGQPGKTLDDAWDIIRPSLPDGTTDENCALIILMNASHYNGTVNYYSQSKRTTGFVCLSPGATGTMQGFENVFVHEVGGHAIGHLADCYTRASTITSAKVQQTLQYQSLGWYLNVDVTGQKETCPWSFIFRAPEYNAYYSAVGLYEGARSHDKGIWRSESISCMNDNRFYYDAASRYAIVKQLKESAGETINWKDFVNKDYDRANANTGTRAEQIVPYNFLPLPEPTIIDK